MPDSPDYSKFLGQSIRFSLQDMGELAARLGSINVFDRRGETLLTDDCSHGTDKWSVLGGGAGFGVNASTDHACFSAYSLKFITGLGGAGFAELEKYFDLMDVKRVGFEFLFAYGMDVDLFDVVIDFSNGVNTYRAEIKFNFTDKTLSYVDGAHGDVVLGALKQVFDDLGCFSQLKIVVDIENLTYVRIVQGHNLYEIPETTLKFITASSYEYYRISLRMVTLADTNGYAYLGGFILTANEP